MYATAHRLVSSLGDEGVNVFVHLHGAGFAWPEDPGALITGNPGELVERQTELPPGGNRVLAFLDVVAPDGTGRAEVAAAVAALGDALEGKANPAWWEEGRVVLKLGVDGKLLPQRGEELARLHQAIDRLLARLPGDGQSAS